MKYFKKAYNLFKNEYILTGLIFIIWISFFDSYSLVKKYNVNKKLTQLKLDKKYYLDQIKRDSTSLLQLLTGPENLE